MPKPPPKGPLEPLKNDSPPAPKSVRGKPVLDGRPSWAGPYAVSSPIPSKGPGDSGTSLAGQPAAPSPPAASPQPPSPPIAMTDATIPPTPATPAAAAADLAAADAPEVKAMIGRFGTPRGPEYRVFPVTKDGRGPKLFSFPPEAYKDEDILKAKIARDHGPGEYDVIGFNEKGQTVAGSAGRLYVEDSQAPRASAATAPVQVMPARSDDLDFKREFFALLQTVVAKPQPQHKAVDWAAVATGGAAVVGAFGAILTPVALKVLDVKNKAGVPPDPMEAITKALTIAETLKKSFGGSGGGDHKTSAYDVAVQAMTHGKEILKDLKDMMIMDGATPPAKRPPPAAPAPAPAAPPPPPSPAPAQEEPPHYAASPAGLLEFVNSEMDELMGYVLANRPAKIGAAYLAVLLEDVPQLLPIARQVLAMPQLLDTLARHDWTGQTSVDSQLPLCA